MLDGYIQDYGVEAVTGRRVLSSGEIKRMVIQTNIVQAYKSREAYKVDGKPDWAKWAQQHPDLARILGAAEAEANAE